MWGMNHSRAAGPVTVILWDAFPNMVVDGNAERRKPPVPCWIARSFTISRKALPDDRMEETLGAVARGELLPDIRYRIAALSRN